MNPYVLQPPVIVGQTEFFSLGLATRIGEGTIFIKTNFTALPKWLYVISNAWWREWVKPSIYIYSIILPMRFFPIYLSVDKNLRVYMSLKKKKHYFQVKQVSSSWKINTVKSFYSHFPQFANVILVNINAANKFISLFIWMYDLT